MPLASPSTTWLVPSPHADWCRLPFVFLLPGSEGHSSLLWSFDNTECETGSVVRRYEVAPNMQFEVAHDTHGENFGHLPQNRVFGFRL